MNKQRKKCEELIYSVFDAMDPTKTNSRYYADKFAKMSDEQFKKFIKKDFPFVYQYRPFEVEPIMENMEKAAKILKVPITEGIYQPYVATNSDGDPVITPEAIVGYMDLKKLKQFITKKNSMSTNISDRDMRDGLLLSHDKNSKESDREIESLVIMGHEHTMREMARYRADSMEAKNVMHNTISLTGQVYQEDIPVSIDDSLSKNMVDVYLVGSLLDSNMVTMDRYAKLSYNRSVTRETE